MRTTLKQDIAAFMALLGILSVYLWLGCRFW